MGLGTLAISCRLAVLAHLLRGADEDRLHTEEEEDWQLLLMIGPSRLARERALKRGGMT